MEKRRRETAWSPRHFCTSRCSSLTKHLQQAIGTVRLGIEQREYLDLGVKMNWSHTTDQDFGVFRGFLSKFQMTIALITAPLQPPGMKLTIGTLHLIKSESLKGRMNSNFPLMNFISLLFGVTLELFSLYRVKF